ncbi:unnamed protein product [Prunus armeniaca]
MLNPMSSLSLSLHACMDFSHLVMCFTFYSRSYVMLCPKHPRVTSSFHLFIYFFCYPLFARVCLETPMSSYSLFIWVLLSPNLDSHTSSDLRGSDRGLSYLPQSSGRKGTQKEAI